MSARVCRFGTSQILRASTLPGSLLDPGGSSTVTESPERSDPGRLRAPVEQHPDNCAPRTFMGADDEAAPGSATARGRRASPSSFPALEAATLHRWVHGDTAAAKLGRAGRPDSRYELAVVKDNNHHVHSRRRLAVSISGASASAATAAEGSTGCSRVMPPWRSHTRLTRNRGSWWG
jgi:hypothetical protein